jgi:hypothetical protein
LRNSVTDKALQPSTAARKIKTLICDLAKNAPVYEEGYVWGAINQPCLVVFGTAIPSHYYEALSERMLTNGFFARMIILDCGGRSPGQEPGLKPFA